MEGASLIGLYDVMIPLHIGQVMFLYEEIHLLKKLFLHGTQKCRLEVFFLTNWANRKIQILGILYLWIM